MFNKRNKKERDRKDKVLQILVQFAGTYLRECPGKKSSLNLSTFFSFYFCQNVSVFINFESSLKFFSAEFSVEFSFSCLTW